MQISQHDKKKKSRIGKTIYEKRKLIKSYHLSERRIPLRSDVIPIDKSDCLHKNDGDVAYKWL